MSSSPAIPSDTSFARIDALRDEWVRLNAEIARLEGRKAAVLAERFDILKDDAPPGSFHFDTGFRSMAAEFAAAAHMSPGPVEGAFCNADRLMRDLPATARALAEGRISARHAEAIISASGPLTRADQEDRDDFERRVLDVAFTETPARTGAHAKAVAAAISPETVTSRHKSARTTRSVRLSPLDDGMALLSAVVPEILGRAALDRLTGLAKAVLDGAGSEPDRSPSPSSAPPSSARGPMPDDGTGPDDGTATSLVEESPRDERTLNQVRADIFVDLLLAAHTETVSRSAEESITATVQVTISSATLLGKDERLAELDGHGPALPDLARSLAGGAGSWNRLFLDPSGMAVATDNYVPTAGMKRFLRARDQRCRFPGCRMPVHRCQIDHNHDHARGGPTAICNLCHFCTVHHVLKHPDVDERYRWSARQLAGGVIEWTSPGGAVYIDEPSRRVMFA